MKIKVMKEYLLPTNTEELSEKIVDTSKKYIT